MSKFNKIYEYEYHLFGQVSGYSEIIIYAHMELYVCSVMFYAVYDFFLVSLCLHPAPECDSNNDVSIRPLTGSGV